MSPSPSLVDLVRARFTWLARFHPEIGDCRVLLDLPTTRHRHGNPLRVRIEVDVPGGELTVDRELPVGRTQRAPRHAADAGAGSTDAEQAILRAFDVTRRRLEDEVRMRRGDVKRHALTE